MCGKKSKAGLEKEETEDRIEDLLERLGLGIMVLTAYFASEKDEVGDNNPLPVCTHLSQVKSSKSFFIICYSVFGTGTEPGCQ